MVILTETFRKLNAEFQKVFGSIQRAGASLRTVSMHTSCSKPPSCATGPTTACVHCIPALSPCREQSGQTGEKRQTALPSAPSSPPPGYGTNEGGWGTERYSPGRLNLAQGRTKQIRKFLFCLHALLWCRVRTVSSEGSCASLFLKPSGRALFWNKGFEWNVCCPLLTPPGAAAFGFGLSHLLAARSWACQCALRVCSSWGKMDM